MPSSSSDPIGPWFIAAEALGEYIGIRFGRVAPGDNTPEWIFLRHTDVDGIGGMADLLRRRGAEIPRLPQIKHPSAPSAFSLLRSMPKYLRPRHPARWRPLEGERRNSTHSDPPPAVAWHIFDEPESTQIRRVCRKAGVTINSFLVKHLTKAIRPSLEDESSVVPWMIPVNVRGKVDLGRDTANHTSYVGVRVRSYETVRDVHRNIYEALGRGEHWANWQAYQFSRFLPFRVKKSMLAQGKATSEWYLGGFSNLGDWDPESRITRPECQGGWLFAPPVLRCQLLGAGCVTFQNRLSLTLQVHPELSVNPEVPAAWVQNWIKEIEIDLASVLSEPVAHPHPRLVA